MDKNINNIDNKVSLGFAALYPEVEENIPSAKEKKIKGKDFIIYGTDNKYPDFLYGLYSNCSTLQSIINGTTDYVKGNKIFLQGIDNKVVNLKGETITDIIERCISDYLIFGHFFLQIIRNRVGGIGEIYWIDAIKVRTNESNQTFYYSEDWTKSYGRVDYTVYPKFNPDNVNIPTSIIMIKTPQSRGTYGIPIWGASIKSALIETKIEDFHLNEISNNFLGSAIINFNNGRPSDEQKHQIENDIEEKFAGEGNSGRILLSFNDSEANKTTVERLGTDDFDVRYSELSSRTREQLFISFRAIPILFGLTSGISTGFSTDEFNQSFQLFNKTMVKPIQDKIIECMNKIYGPSSIIIEPFKIEFQKVEEDGNIN